MIIPLDAANRADHVADITLVAGALVLVVVLQAPHINCDSEYRLTAQLRYEVPSARGSFRVCEVGNGAPGVVVEVGIEIGRAVDVARDRAGLLSLLGEERDREEVKARVGAHDPLVVAVVRVDPHLLVAPHLETHHGRVACHLRARVVRDGVRRDRERRGLR